MRLRNRTPVTLLILCVCCALVGASSAIAQDRDDTEKRVRVMVKKSMADCDGEECEDNHFVVRTAPSGKRVMVFGDDGEGLEELHGQHRVFVSKSGETVELDDGANVFWANTDGDFVFGGGFLGVQLTELTDALRDHFGVRPGVGVMVSEVVEGSPAEQAGFSAGDIITAVDGEEIKSSRALTRKVRSFEEGENASFEIVRNQSQQNLNASIGKRESQFAQLRELGGDDRFYFRGGHRGMHIERCEEGSEDCDVQTIVKKLRKVHGDDMHVLEIDGMDLDSFDCGDASNCEIQVTCDDGDCECEVNGESVACQQ